MKFLLAIPLLLSLSFCKTYATEANCETALANASSAAELIAKAEGAGFKLDAKAKARIVACFKPKRKRHHAS